MHRKTRETEKARPLSRLNLAVASQGAAQVILLSLIPLISGECGIGIAAIGGLVAIGTLCLMLAGPLWGMASDRYGRKPVVVAGLAGSFLAQVLFVGLLLSLAEGKLEVSGALLPLGISRALYGLFAAAIYPACQAWTLELSGGERRLAALSGLSAATNLGRGLGPLLALAGLSAGNLWALGWLMLLPLFALLAVAQIPAIAPSPQQPERAPLLTLPICTLFAVALLGTLTIGQLQLALGPVLLDFYALSPTQASSIAALLLAAVAVCGFLLQWGLVRRLDAPRVALAIGATLLVAGAVLLNAMLGNVAMPAGLLLFVAGAAFLTPAYTALLGEAAGDQRGRLFGLLSLMHTAGYTAGFALGGWIYQWLPAAPLVGMLAGALCLAVAAARVIARGGRQAADGEAGFN